MTTCRWCGGDSYTRTEPGPCKACGGTGKVSDDSISVLVHVRWGGLEQGVGSDVPYPHEGGCWGCRVEMRCNVCGKEWKDRLHFIHDRCTNGRCLDCHRKVCTPGGNDSLGHGYGNPTKGKSDG